MDGQSLRSNGLEQLDNIEPDYEALSAPHAPQAAEAKELLGAATEREAVEMAFDLVAFREELLRGTGVLNRRLADARLARRPPRPDIVPPGSARRVVQRARAA